MRVDRLAKTVSIQFDFLRVPLEIKIYLLGSCGLLTDPQIAATSKAIASFLVRVDIVDKSLRFAYLFCCPLYYSLVLR